jgi:2-amino-4-hydroxy-6-hydroxymethyldihydropteridine diphosphokinase
MALIYIGVGSNIDREHYVHCGVQALAASFSGIRLSTVYESQAVGFQGDNFYNLVVEARTEQTVEQVLATLKHIEFAHGRPLDARKFSARTLDLDLLCYDQLLQDAPVELPRAEILTNAFVLRPLAELNPALIHPRVGVSLAELWNGYDASRQPLRPVITDW